MKKARVNNSEEQDAEDARQNLAKLICYERLAPRSFCNSTFKIFHGMDSSNPRLSCLKFDTLESNCLEIYKAERQKVKETFSKHGGKISLSVDLLAHEKQWNRYLCISAHFIDNDWKLQKWVIKYSCFFNGIILKSLKEYDIESKMLSLTVGGTCALDDMVKEVQEDVEVPQLFHMQCISDIITRMIQSGLEEISKIIDKVRGLSWSRSEPLWYLTTFKLSEALKLEEMGEFATVEDNGWYEVPSKEEWEKVRSMCRIADRIYGITKGLFEIKKPTPNHFLPHCQEIRAHLLKESTSSDEFVRLVAQKMLDIFNKYLDDMHLVLSITAFLDPRFKMKFIEFCPSDWRLTTYLESIRKVYDGYVDNVVTRDQKEYPFSDSSSKEEEETEEWSETEAKVKRCDILENLGFVKEYCQSMMQSEHDMARKCDLDLYVEEPILPWTGNFSVLHWWNDNDVTYPRLSRMARDFLAIPMSVATSYDAYYTEPRVADCTLYSLKPVLANALKCTRSWKFGATASKVN
ncbi:Zinc finger BED domain-containing protein RICESLEEPER 2 [Bienertia sinuspersici]